jgi:hypothetical protein
MYKQSARAKPRATNGGILAGITAIGAIGGATAFAVPPASAMPVIANCQGPAATCVAQTAQAVEPQPAPLPAGIIPRSVPGVPDLPITSIIATNDGGYRVSGSDGGVYSFAGSGTPTMLGHRLNGAIVGEAQTTSGGLWLAGSDGGVYALNAPFFGSVAGVHLAAPIVGIAADPLTGGYLLAGADGGVFAFNSPFSGSLVGKQLKGPIVGIAVDPITGGYWLVGSDGGVFAFNAPYLGSLSGRNLGAPIVGIAPTPTGDGYWLVGADGGVFTFGDAPYLGSLGGQHLGGRIVGIAPTLSGDGYWLAGSDGGIFNFGDATYLGNALHGSIPPPPSPPIPPPPPPPRRGRPASAPAAAPGATGIDISNYQCGSIPSGPSGLAVVQVTGGTFYGAPNPCYTAEAAWAGRNMETYVYMNGVPDPAPAAAMAGPAGVCAPGEAPCIAFNYGWNLALGWVGYSYSVGVHPHKWWLDVEKDSGWTGQGVNNLVIEGALDALRDSHLSVGIYSNATQWNAITGGLVFPGIDLWVPGAGNISGPGYTATSFCGDPSQAFAGGRVKYVQYGYTGSFAGAYTGPAPAYDLDYAC